MFEKERKSIMAFINESIDLSDYTYTDLDKIAKILQANVF